MFLRKKVNKIIKVLIVSDFFLQAAWGFLLPVFAIFILEDIAVKDIAHAAEIAGFAAFVYWVTKSILQIPISSYLDDRHGEKDDYWFMVFGLFIASIAPFGFLFSFLPWHIYMLQVLHAIGMALFVPSWNAIFTRHIDKGKEAFEWGMDSTFLGVGTGITGALGGMMVVLFGFKMIFVFAGLLNLVAAFLLLTIHKRILPRDHLVPRVFKKL